MNNKVFKYISYRKCFLNNDYYIIRYLKMKFKHNTYSHTGINI